MHYCYTGDVLNGGHELCQSVSHQGTGELHEDHKDRALRSTQAPTWDRFNPDPFLFYLISPVLKAI